MRQSKNDSNLKIKIGIIFQLKYYFFKYILVIFSNYIRLKPYNDCFSHNEEQGDTLDTQLKEERETMTESEARFEDIARKLATLEAELERSMDRCTTG